MTRLTAELIVRNESEARLRERFDEKWIPEMARLTERDVVEIRRAVGKQRDIAARFGVSQSTVFSIRARETWRHVE